MARTFAELVAATAWPEVKAAVAWLFPDEKDVLAGYRQVFGKLRTMTPEPDSMRLSIEARVLPGVDEQPTPEVVGRNGTLNHDLPDWPFLNADSEYGRDEAVYSLSLQPWRQWLGMVVEQATLDSYSPAQIIAFALREMTFHGFTEAENRAVADELRRRVAELDAMTDEERKETLIPAEQVFAELEAKYGKDDTDA